MRTLTVTRDPRGVNVPSGEGEVLSAGADLEWMKRASDEAREGLDAFLEKRPARRVAAGCSR